MSKKLSFKDELLSLTNAAPVLKDRDDAYSDDGLKNDFVLTKKVNNNHALKLFYFF